MKNNQFQLKTGFFILFSLFFYVLHAQFPCPFMRVSIASDGWVACDNSVAHIRVCNEGAQSASNAQLEVVIPAGFDYVLGSGVPAPNVIAGKTLRYFMGSFAAGDCRNFSLTLAVPCNAQTGAAYCLRASVLPSDCPTSAPGWDGSNLVVKAQCVQDTVKFRVSNTSPNQMTATPGFVIIEDHLIRVANNLPPILGNDTTTVFSWPNPTGSTITFQTSQSPGHPFPEPISVSMEGCGSTAGSTGYLLQYPQYDGNVHGDIFCDVITPGISGYGKTGFPLGYATEHFINRNSSLQYRIRFQNTGPTAIQSVTLTDTLSDALNLSTFRAGAASHPYTYSIQNQVLTVVFSGLQLPPAAVNAVASRGFFSFHIGISDNAPLGTIIENTALVKLGNQQAVRTDTTYHRLGENFMTADIIENQPDSDLKLTIIPNPVTTSAQFVFSGEGANGTVSLQITDISGRVVRNLYTDRGDIYFERDALSAGVYFFTCYGKNGRRICGKLMVL